MTQPPAYGYPAYPPAVPRPGCIPLRPLGVGDIIEGSFRAVQRNPRTMLGLSAAVGVVNAVTLAVVQLALFANVHLSDPKHGSGDLYRLDSTRLDTGRVVLTISLGFLASALTAVFGAFVTGMLTLVVADDVIGRRSALSATWTRVRPRLIRLIWLALLISLVEAVGLMLFVAPGIWLWGIWAVAIPAFMIEETTVGASLGRSRSLVRGTFWRVWGIRSLGALLIGAIAAALSGPFTGLALAVSHRSLTDLASLTDSVPTTYIVISAIGSAIAATLTTPLTAAYSTLQYIDLRMRKENLTGWLWEQASRSH